MENVACSFVFYEGTCGDMRKPKIFLGMYISTDFGFGAMSDNRIKMNRLYMFIMSEWISRKAPLITKYFGMNGFQIRLSCCLHL